MPRILDGGAPFSPLTTGEPTQNPQQPTKTPSNQPATNMSSTPIGIPTNTTDDETLLRVTRSGALFGAPPVLEPEEESSTGENALCMGASGCLQQERRVRQPYACIAT